MVRSKAVLCALGERRPAIGLRRGVDGSENWSRPISALADVLGGKRQVADDIARLYPQ